jgi:hypothetical protein
MMGELVEPSPFFLLIVPSANKIHQEVPEAVRHRHPILLRSERVERSGVVRAER